LILANLSSHSEVEGKLAGIEQARRDSKSLVLSLAKGFRILEVFDGTSHEMTLTQIAARADLDPGTAHRLTKTLVMLGYLRQTPGSKRYHLGLKVLDLGFNALARMDLRDSARPVLRSLVGQLSEAASIGVLDGADVVYIERVQANLVRLGVSVRVGSRIPAYCTALGHSILAYIPLEKRLEILNSRERLKLTPRTPVTIPDIEARLEAVRRLGYALSDQESVNGLRVLAAPILDSDRHPFAGISVAAPSVASTLEEFVTSAAGPVMRAAAELGKLFSASGVSAAANH
jgi:IclR family transcriptional regulator, pca regulon regulatory protein